MGFINKRLGLFMVLSTMVIIGFAQNLVPGGVSAGANVTLDCSSGPCTTLSADFHQSTETNARYTVTSIPMDPVGVTLPSSINADDDYSGAIDLGFTFCFFGDQKTQIVIGDNGLISFNVAGYAGNTNAQYTVPADVPSGNLPLDAVFGAYHDLFINEGGEITYGVTGTAPFRAFVINYRNVAQYSAANGCTNPTTQQIVLHETSNFIDVYLTDKPACTGWQNGAAIVGIQLGNGSGGNFFVAPGRNMSDSPWSAIDEAWRFAPEEDGAPTYTFEWINMTTGLVESTDPNYEVCPTETTIYRAHVTWVNCVGGTEEATDGITVTVDLPFTLDIDGGDQDFCVGDPTYTINTTITTTAGISITGYNWFEAADPSTSLGTSNSLTVSTTGTYVIEVTDSGGCVLQQQVDITYNPVPDGGTDGTIDFCSTDTAADLFASLGGTPDTGGIWSPALTSGTGFFDPSVDTAGTYTYTVDGNGCPDATAAVDVTITSAPNAGTNGNVDFCSTDVPADLFDSLNGTPDTGGTWSPVLTSGTGIFDPALDTAGTYVYTVVATGNCMTNAIANVNVGIDIAPNAGTNGAINFCSTDTSVDLFASLGGTPDTTGVWSPTLTSGTGVFDPSVDTAGTYTYVVSGGACADDTSEVLVTIDIAPNAGTDNSISFCSTDATADLFTSLGGTPDTGGSWSPTLTSGTGFFDPAVDPAGPYSYTVAGTGSCADATATITVTVDIAPNAGTDGTVDFCTTDVTADLFASLGGTPDPAGTWSPALTSGTGVFDPSVDAAGAYVYTVNGTGICANVTAQVDVTVYIAPNAGTDGMIDFCTTDASADLFASLGGAPDTGGTWSPILTSGTGIFDPAVDLAGTYTYTVTPTGTCLVDATADVVVTTYVAPTSGTAVSPNLILCNTDTALDLDTSLTGADAGGSWSDDDTTGGLAGNMFDSSGLATGTYDFTYTVAALGPCPQTQTTVSIEVTAAPNAGVAVAISDICDTETALDLTTGLTGQDAGGSWNDDDGTGGLTLNLFDATGVAAGTYNFTYTVAPTGPCVVADTETVQVTVIRSPVAGDDADDFFCMTDVSRDLFNTLGGLPDLGGIWSPILTSGTGDFNPAVDSAGIYTYTVSGSGVCVDDTATVTVTLSEAPIITSIDVVDFSENNTITISVEGIVSATLFGIGDYEYSIDGVSFQSENIFENVAPGTYTVTVRDVNGCMPDVEVTNVNIMGAPKFFTPNNDGENDTWQIVNIQSQPEAQISIYDRFGKLIIQFDGASQGWEGIYNNELLPSTDYWFSISMNDVDGNPVIRRGHFSLIRR